MPATYAHQMFGDLVFAALPDAFRSRVAAEKDLFNIGLQGPDILFYYHPLKSNPVSRLGHEMHCESGRELFEKALKESMAFEKELHTSSSVEKTQSGSLPEPAMIYLYGVLCHFSLDSTCHGYINQYEKDNGVSHCDIEGELDRYLIERAGKDPLKENLTKDFHASKRSAGFITPFYRGLPEKTIYSALKSFKGFHSLLYCPRDLKRNALYRGLKLIGQYEGLRGHIISKDANPACAGSDKEIEERIRLAVPLAVRLITQFPGNMEDEAYLFNFNGERV